MKLITNWQRATVSDIEANGLLQEATKMHVLVASSYTGKSVIINGSDHKKIQGFFEYHIKNNIPVVMHNGITFDIPLVEKLLGIDLSGLMVIDSLCLSWYLNIDRNQHGLSTFHEDYGIEKPPIEDWENLTYEEYLHRCSEDVRINTALWEDFKERLQDIYAKVKCAVDSGDVDGNRTSDEEVCYIDQYKNSSSVEDYIDRILTFLMFKADCARLKEKTRFKVDVPALDSLIDNLSVKTEEAKKELESVMPKVPQYVKKTRPKKMFKMDGSLSAHGVAWEEDLKKIRQRDEDGNLLIEMLDVDTIKILRSYEPPNINGHQQIKDFLFSKGWKPLNFKFVKDEEAEQLWADSGYKKHLKPKPRAVPQVSIDGDDGKELCPSVLQLAQEVPEIMSYAKYTTIKHRLDMCKGFKRDLREGGYLCARVGGYTNTLREQHRELVNLPSFKKPYGKEVRGLLIADKGGVLLGSDLSSLEDRVKHHFMIPYDPEYVSTMMASDYDPHITTALAAGMITEEDFNNFKSGKKETHVIKARQTGKSTNYAAVYNSGAETLARTSGMSIADAKVMLEGYWKLNWSVKKIAEDQCIVVDSKSLKWLVNPINGFAYSLRSEKDRFSTLCQGTGSFFFDMWVDEIITRMLESFKVKRLSAEFHDEFVLCFKDSENNKIVMGDITKNSIIKINERYKLRRQLGCDVQFGYKYSEIH